MHTHQLSMASYWNDKWTGLKTIVNGMCQFLRVKSCCVKQSIVMHFVMKSVCAHAYASACVVAIAKFLGYLQRQIVER
jgi:hypothetical protein